MVARYSIQKWIKCSAIWSRFIFITLCVHIVSSTYFPHNVSNAAALVLQTYFHASRSFVSWLAILLRLYHSQHTSTASALVATKQIGLSIAIINAMKTGRSENVPKITCSERMWQSGYDNRRKNGHDKISMENCIDMKDKCIIFIMSSSVL